MPKPERDVLDAEMGALLDELIAWRKSGFRRHDGAFHMGDMSPGMQECPGCRANRVSRRLADLVSALDDEAPQDQYDGKSRLEIIFEGLEERRVKEGFERNK